MVGFQAGDVLLLKVHLSAGGSDLAGQNVEQGRLARPIGADDGMNRPLFHLQVHPIHGRQPAELLGEICGAQNHDGTPLRLPFHFVQVATPSPQIPPRMNSTKTTKITPRMKSQRAQRSLRTSEAILVTSAPITGP
jgi:hypothetical protein